MNRTMRTLSRTAGAALALSGAALFVAGQASANDRAVVVSCTDQSAGTWEVSVTFSSIEVKADRPVDVTLGSSHATLTEPGPNGTVTLSQHFGGDQDAASLTWSVVRLDYQNMGVLHLDRPAECRPAPPSSEAPTTPAPPTAPPATVLAETVTPAPSVQSAALPETGRPTLPLIVLGAGAVVGGLGLVGAARRRPENA
jgi:LPXTG-motif cell wall-anchored protein